MRKFLACFLCLFLLLCGCTEHPQASKGEKLRVTATIFPPYDFVRQIAGDKVELTMLLPLGSESHNFEPTLATLTSIRNSDLLFYAGDDSDEWVKALDQTEYSDTKMLPLSGMVVHSEEHSDGDEHENEHIWTSPRNAMQIVKSISDELCKSDPNNAEYYKENTEKYLEQLQKLDSDIADMIAAAPLKTLVFADRFPFASFAEDYGLECFAAFDHCSSDFEPTIDAIQSLIVTVRKLKIPEVFYIEFSDQRVADMICAATGCKKALFHSCHNVTKEEFSNGATYLSLMRDNLAQLGKALNYAT